MSKHSENVVRLAVFASGRGSNLQAIYHTIASGSLPGVELVLVVSNNSSSGALEFARANGVEGKHLSLITAGDEAALEREMLTLLESKRVDLIALAGYMKMLPQSIIERYTDKIVNVHPALLPSFGGKDMYGMRVHEAVLAHGCKVSGATAHLVNERYDEGRILLQACCEVLGSDTAETLSLRVRAIEHRLLPQAIGVVASTISKQSH